MKKLVFLSVVAFSIFVSNANGQMYHPWFSNYVGYGVMVFTDYWGFPTCMYMGDIYYGRPQGNGYVVWADGSFFSGGFHNGFAHGNGVVGNYMGYISGTWNMGTFVGVNNQYNNRDYERTISNVNTRQRNNNQAPIANVDPNGYRVEKLDANTQYGKVLLGKVGK